MTPISSRYAPHLLVLLLLAAIPVYLNTSGRGYVDDCHDPEGLRDLAAWGTTDPLEEQWQRRGTRRIQWSEGRLVVDEEAGSELTVAVLRSFRPLTLYLRPMRFYRFDPETMDVQWVDAGSDSLPIHVVTSANQRPIRFAEYLVVYDSKALTHPFAYQLTTAIPELFRGRPPVTMFIVYGEVTTRIGLANARRRAESWLVDAWKRYRAACSDSSDVAVSVPTS